MLVPLPRLLSRLRRLHFILRSALIPQHIRQHPILRRLTPAAAPLPRILSRHIRRHSNIIHRRRYILPVHILEAIRRHHNITKMDEAMLCIHVKNVHKQASIAGNYNSCKDSTLAVLIYVAEN